MCEALRELMKEEIDAEVEKGMEKGKAEGTLLAISNLMKSMKLNAEQAMEALGIPANEWASYRAKL